MSYISEIYVVGMVPFVLETDNPPDVYATDDGTLLKIVSMDGDERQIGAPVMGIVGFSVRTITEVVK